MTEDKLQKTELWMFLIAVFIAGIGLHYLGPSMTGFVIKELSYVDEPNLVVTSSGNYTWLTQNFGDLKNMKIDGRVTNSGRARAYIENNGKRYLIFDSKRIGEAKANSTWNESSNLVTGFAVKKGKGDNKTESDEDKKKNNHEPEWQSDADEFTINQTSAINLSQYFTDKDDDALVYSLSQAEGIDILLSGEIAAITSVSGKDFNTTITFTASDGIDSKSETVKLTVYSAKQQQNSENNQTANLTGSTNETISTINPTQPANQSDETANTTIPKTNHAPAWNSGIESFVLNKTLSIDLSQYFTDEDNDTLGFGVSETAGISENMSGSILALTTALDNFNTTITVTASDGNLSAGREIKLIVPSTSILNKTIPSITNQTADKTIAINLSYNAGTVYDANDNGEESINGIVDLTVADTKFGWDADLSKLCTRWEVYSAEDEKLTTFCNGNPDCCAFVNLLPTKDNWSDIYYSAFGKDGAGHNNIVSAQVIYYDANLTLGNAKSEIYSSEWENKSVKFFEEETEFSDECLETCSLKGLNKSSYNLAFEIEDNAVLRISRIKYSMLADVKNKPPLLLQNFSTINVSKNKNMTISLSQYFSEPDGDALAYSYYKADNITVLFDKDIATIIPDKGVEGLRYTYFIANDSEYYAVSNLFAINISQEKYKPKVEIGKKVKWKNTILIDADNVSSVNLTLPETASNITIGIINGTIQRKLPDYKIKFVENGRVKDKNIFEAEKHLDETNKKIRILEEAKRKKSLKVVEENELKTADFDSKLNELYNEKSELQQQLQAQNSSNLITGNIVALSETAINETMPTLFINESLPKNAEVQIEYETEAPIAIENEINAYTKQVKVVSDTSYEDVLSYTSLNDVPQNAIKLYWLKDTGRELFTNVKYYDGNNNSLIDRIEWVIPHLSNQTFEVSISVLNVQSYPTVGGNWTVAFNTTGTGNLTIFAFNGTTYAEKETDDNSTINDLDILELKCDNNILEPYYIVDLGNLSLEAPLISGDVVEEIGKEKGFGGLLTLNSLDESPFQASRAFASKADVDEVDLYLNIPKNSIKNKEKTEFHNQVLQTDSAALTELTAKKTSKYINFSFLNHNLSKAGVAQSGTAADSDSAALTGLRVRNLGLESNSEVPSSSAQKNNQNLDAITNFFTIIPSAYALHIGSGSYATINFNGNTYALLTKSQLTGHSYKIIGVYYSNYNCDNSTGYWTVHVLTAGVHNQRLNFSDFIADAHNLASAAGGTSNGSIFRFVDDTDTDFYKGNLSIPSITSMVVGTGAGANLTINISSLQNQTQNIQGRGINANASTVLYLRFEEGTGQYANDSSLYGNNGTLGGTNAANANDPSWNSTTKFGSFGLTFNGSYVNITPSNRQAINLSTHDFALEAWVRTSDTSTSGTNKGIISSRVTAQSYYAMILADDTSTYNQRCDTADASAQTVKAGTKKINDGQWHHLVCSRVGNVISLYVDGIMDVTQDFGVKRQVDLQSDLIIGSVGGSGAFLYGDIDEISIWNISLSNETILQQYQLGWGYFNTSNFTSQVFDANAIVNWSSISWSTEANDKGVSNLYQSDISDLINSSTVLYMKFNNDTQESEKQLNVTHNISAETNLVLYMPFDSSQAKELVPNGSTVLLMHFNNDTGTGENASLFLNNATFGNGTGIGNATCVLTGNQCPVFNESNPRFGKSALTFDGVNDFVNITSSTNITKIQSDFTWEFWFKSPRNGEDGQIISSFGSNGIFVGWPGDGTGKLRFNLNSGTQITFNSQSQYGDNNWHHVALVHSGDDVLTGYVDGAQVGQGSNAGGSITYGASMLIGTYSEGTTSNFFNGSIDELSIWNVSLSSEIIARHSGYGIDKSIYGNNASFINGSSINQTAGSCKFGECMVFDGIDDAVTMVNTSILDFSADFTVEAWIKNIGTANGVSPAIVAKRLLNSNGKWQFDLNNADGNPPNVIDFTVVNTAGGTYLRALGGIAIAGDKQWHHVVGTVTGTTIRSYVDGVLQVSSSSTSGTRITSQPDPVTIGQIQGAYFNGTIDEVAIWNISLSSDKIAEHAGAKVLDYSNYGNNGTRNFNSSSDFGANFTYGKFGKALVFDGVNDFVNVSIGASVKGKNQSSVEAWVLTNSVTGSGLIYGEPISTSDSSSRFVFGRGGSGAALIGIGRAPDSQGAQQVTTAEILTTGTWYHVASTFDVPSNVIKIYVNGIQQATTGTVAFTNGAFDNTNPPTIYIGVLDNNNPGVGFWNGQIDELSIWNVSLTSDDIRKHYERGVLKLNLSYRTSNDNSTWSSWNPVSNSSLSLITSNAIARYFQYKAAFNTTDSKFTPIINNVSINYSLRSNLTIWDDTDTLIKVLGQPIRFYANFTDGVNSINGSSINCTFSNNLTGAWSAAVNMSFNSTTGIYFIDNQFSTNTTSFFNVSCDASILGYNKLNALDSFVIYPSLNITLNLNASSAIVSSPIAIFGHINLSNGTNFSNNVINIFLNGALLTLQNLTANGYYAAKQFIDDLDTDFLKGNLTSSSSITSMVVGTGAGANLTINISSLQNQTQNIQGRGITVNASTILYLKFEEGTGQYANDSSLYGNNGTLGNTNAAASDDPVWNSSAKFGSFGLTFDGVNDMVRIPYNNTLNVTTAVTMEAWVTAMDNSPAVYLYAVQKKDSVNQNGISLGIAGENGPRAGRPYFNIYGGAAAGSCDGTGYTQLISNTWHHLVGTFGASTIKVYIDGVLDNISSCTFSTIVVDNASLFIGARTESSQFWNGTIDEVSIWNTTLTNDTILQQYQLGWGYFNTSNFTSQVFDANAIVNWTSISWSTEANDKGVSNLYQSDLSDLINASTVLYMKFNNDTLESERQLNATYNISAETNLVLYMPFDSSQAKELVPNGSTVLLMHFNNDTGTGENASLFLNNATDSTGKGLGNGTCSKNPCPTFNESNPRLGKSSLDFMGLSDFVNISDNAQWDFGNREFAIEFWVKWKGYGQAFIGQWGGAGGRAWEFYQLNLPSQNGDVFFGYTTDGSTEQSVSADAPVPNQNEWHHYAVVRAGNNINFYYDGSKIGDQSFTATIASVAQDVSIGELSNARESNYSMDEVAIWNISLSSEIIAKHSGYGIDRSIYGNNASLMNGSVINQSGKFGEAMQFDGKTSFVNVSYSRSLNISNSFTIEMWFNQYGQNANGDWGLLDLGNETVADAQHSVVVFSGNTQNKLFFDTGTGTTTQQLSSSSTIDTNRWYHAAFVRDLTSGLMKIYINGVLDASATASGTSVSNSNYHLKIGKLIYTANGLPYYFNGTLDEVAVWNTTLTSDKIAEHAGAKIIDYSQYGNNGTRFSNTTSDFGRNFTDGKFGKALLFDGVNDWINVSDANSLDLTTKGTIEAWFYWRSSDAFDDFIISKGDAAGSTNSQNYRLSIVDSVDDKIYCTLADGATNVQLASNFIAPTNRWVYAACVWENNVLKLYVNGILDISTSFTITPAANLFPVIIGGLPGAGGDFNGIIDEPAIWNVSLSSDDIRKHYERGVLKLNLSYRTSNDNSTWSSWTGVSNNSLSGFSIADDSLVDVVTHVKVRNSELKRLYENKEKTEFHNQTLTAESVTVPRQDDKETNNYKNLSVLNKELSRAGVAQPGTAADSDSAPFHGMRVRNLGFESESEVPSSSAQNLGISDDVVESVVIKNDDYNKIKEKRGSQNWQTAAETAASTRGISNRESLYINVSVLGLSKAGVPELADGAVSKTAASTRGVGVRTSTSEIPLLSAQNLDISGKNTNQADLENLNSEKSFDVSNLRNLFNLASTSSSAKNLNFGVDKSFTSQPFSSIVQSSLDMRFSQGWVGFGNILKAFSGFEHFQYGVHHDSGALESGLAVADFAVRNDKFIDFGSHGVNQDYVVFKDYDNYNHSIIPINEFQEICPSLDCNAINYITAKKKIKDVKEGDYVLSLDEKTGKIAPKKVNALLDHGIKPIYELKTISEKSINTTAEHPYLAKLYTREECDKYADAFWNINASKTEDFNGDYCTRWVEVSDLKEGMEIAVPKTNNYFVKNISTNSGVEYTLTSPCSLKDFSLDHIAHRRCNASAKYGTSLPCGANFSALDCIAGGNLNMGNISTLLLSISNSSITSASESPQILAIVPVFLLNSSIKYGKATSFSFSSKNKSFVLPLPIMAANKTVASTTNSIYFSSRNFFATASEILSVNSLASLSEILILDDISLSLFNFSDLSNIALVATSDQFSLNSFMSFSNSSGTDIVIFPILQSPEDSYEKGYLNVVEKDKGSDVEFEKITSIKVLDKQHVYDLSIEGTHNFIANDIVAHNTGNAIARYFQYKVDLNTTDARFTPILNNVTINYTGVFTDSLGNYNYTFTAPSAAGTYTIKVNTTYANTIPGEQLAALRILNSQTINLAAGGAFIIQNSSGNSLAVIDSLGNMNIKGALTSNAEPTANPKDFAIQNSTGGLNLVITNPDGNLLIKNSLLQNQGQLSPTLKSFIVQNKTGNTVAYANSTGGLFLAGSLTQNVQFS